MEFLLLFEQLTFCRYFVAYFLIFTVMILATIISRPPSSFRSFATRQTVGVNNANTKVTFLQSLCETVSYVPWTPEFLDSIPLRLARASKPSAILNLRKLARFNEIVVPKSVRARGKRAFINVMVANQPNPVRYPSFSPQSCDLA